MVESKQPQYTFEPKARDIVLYVSVLIGLAFGLHRWWTGSGEFGVNALAGIATGFLMGMTLIIIVTAVEYHKQGTDRWDE